MNAVCPLFGSCTIIVLNIFLPPCLHAGQALDFFKPEMAGVLVRTFATLLVIGTLAVAQKGKRSEDNRTAVCWLVGWCFAYFLLDITNHIGISIQFCDGHGVHLGICWPSVYSMNKVDNNIERST